MAETLRFTTTPLPDGSIKLPRDIARRAAGALSVEVEITLRKAHSRLAERGVTAGEVAAVGSVQRLEPDVVEYVLGGEGSVAADSPLFRSLLQFSLSQ